jgi:hypothetical protein
VEKKEERVNREGIPEVPEIGRKEIPKAAPSLFESLALDLDFLVRVYRTGAILLVIGGMLAWARLSAAAGAGFALGGALSLLMLWGMEVTVRALIKPGSRSARGLIGAMLLKLLIATLVLFFCFLGAMRGWVSLFWVLLGFAMPHLVISLKLLGQQIRRVYAGQ